jgi:hypothetical protein
MEKLKPSSKSGNYYSEIFISSFRSQKSLSWMFDKTTLEELLWI